MAPSPDGLKDLEQRLRQSGTLPKVEHDPTVLSRFLTAGGGSVTKAAQLVETMLAWREGSAIDRLVREFEFTEREAFLAAYPQGYHKTDRQGRPVYIQQLGRADVDTILSITTEQRLINFHLQELERMLGVILPACNVIRGSPPRACGALPAVRGSCSVLDLQGVGFGSLIKAKRLLTLFLALDAAYFPETMDTMLVVGAPSWFSGALGAFKSVLSPELQSRMEVIGGDFRPRLKELIGEENLLPEYGGTSSGRLQDDDGPWRDPAVLAAAGLLPDAAPAPGAPPPPLPPANSLLLRMARALARGGGGAAAGNASAAELQPSVMVVTHGDASTQGSAEALAAWQSLPKAPSARARAAARKAAAAPARHSPAPAPAEAAAAAPAKVVRPSPFANPQQHIATLDAIHSGRKAAAPRAAAPPAAAPPAAAPAVGEMPQLARVRVASEPAAGAPAAPLPELHVPRAHHHHRGAGLEGLPSAGEASFKSAISKAPSGPLSSRTSGAGGGSAGGAGGGGGAPLGGAGSRDLSGFDGAGGGHGRGARRSSAASDAWQERYDELEALASCYLTPHGSFCAAAAAALADAAGTGAGAGAWQQESPAAAAAAARGASGAHVPLVEIRLPAGGGGVSAAQGGKKQGALIITASGDAPSPRARAGPLCGLCAARPRAAKAAGAAGAGAPKPARWWRARA